MGVNYFSDEQVKELEKNTYVKKVSIKSITYSEEFKELFWIDLQNGMMPGNIFRKYGFDPTGTTEYDDKALSLMILEELIQDVEAKDDNMGKIIRLLFDGFKKNEILRKVELGKGKTQGYAFIEKAKKIALEIYNEKYRK
ncbi:HTH domain-containing protein [Catenibacterium mitsuokai]|uniref:HTH domain-containing protein n=1 Tax=Catenibacterium mitsuokai TaxID=100886 RepID=UPI003F8B23E9